MARKHKGLPFVVQPRLKPIIERIGTEESGVFEIQRLGYLTVAEKTIVDQASVDMSDQTDLLVAVRTISEAEKMSMSEVFEALQDGTGKNSKMLEKYAVEISTASASARTQEEKVKLVAATALIMCRVDPTWTVNETMDLHPDLIDGLNELYKDESERSLEAFEAQVGQAVESESALKK